MKDLTRLGNEELEKENLASVEILDSNKWETI